MGNENHMRKAGQEIARGATNAVNEASNGQLADAAQSAWAGTVSSAQEVGKSVTETAQFLTGRQRDNK